GAVITGLKELRRPEEVARLRGKAPEEFTPTGLLRAYRERQQLQKEARASAAPDAGS
ncbi:MAG TPA: 30S ribosomal protein S5, partial [Acidimicrobiia bacterium]|nr:30S ribosomal protein S5 [Acidimicrobiia bacterium]